MTSGSAFSRTRWEMVRLRPVVAEADMVVVVVVIFFFSAPNKAYKWHTDADRLKFICIFSLIVIYNLSMVIGKT
jgi:hypothetical protein